MVIVAAGPVEHDEFVNMVSKAFAGTPTTPSGPGVVSLAPAYFTGSDIRVRDDEVNLNDLQLMLWLIPAFRCHMRMLPLHGRLLTAATLIRRQLWSCR